MGDDETLIMDLERQYENACNAVSDGTHVIYTQNIQKIRPFDDLFYTSVIVNDHFHLNGMLDTGSMSCTLSEAAEQKLLSENAVLDKRALPENIVLVGVGGRTAQPKCLYEVNMKVYGICCRVPILVVPGQHDDLILGTNLIKHIVSKMKNTDEYWDFISQSPTQLSQEGEHFLDVMSNITRWRHDEIPHKIGTVKLQRAVTLAARQEHLVWGRLPSKTPLSLGSTILVEPTTSKTMPRNIMVARVITSMWGDRWVPMKITNLSDLPVTLRKNRRLADVSPCLAVEDFPILQGTGKIQMVNSEIQANTSCTSNSKLNDVGLDEIDIDLCKVTDASKEKLVQLLIKYNDVFSKHSLDCGEAKEFEHCIRLTDERPFRLPYRRIPPAHYQKLRQALTEMEEQGIIRKSVSEYASPLVLVWKKDGSLRICTDFRWLNARTLKDAHPLPHQSDCLAALGGNNYFSTMDLTSGFYNLPMREQDKKYTAFVTPMGLHEYNRMPQGLCNSPASFMRMMLSIFGDMNFSSLLCYLDDLLVFASTEEEALNRLEIVFHRLRMHRLKLSPKKCQFLRDSVKFLGHIISGSGISVDSAKVDVISKMSKSQLMEEDGCTPSPKRIKSFLGMIFYYQHFIPNCSAIAKPLFALTAGQKRRGKVRSGKHVGTFRKLNPSDWVDECDVAFSMLKEKLLKCAVLAHPDFSKPLILSIDASLDGLGAVLSQVPAGEEIARPIAFASKTLSVSQKKYPAHRLEFLALKWSVCEKFSHWLKGHTFTVWTDNNPLTYIMSKPKLDACEQRWVSKLAPYSFDIKHIAGTKNVVADTLSRDPFARTVSHRLMNESYNHLLTEADAVKEDGIQDAFRLKVECHKCNDRVECLSRYEQPCDSVVIKLLCQVHDEWETATFTRAVQLAQSVCQVAAANQISLLGFSHDELQRSQELDSTISKVLPLVIRKRRPSRRERDQLDIRALTLIKQWDRLKIQDGILYRVTKDPVSRQKRHQYVLPQCMKEKALSGLHDLAGHQGQARTIHLARQRFFWPKMDHEIKEYVKCCRRCILAKTPEPAARAPLESIKTSAPMELVCLDFWSAEDNKQRSVDVLVLTDHFTKLAHAFPCINQTAKQVARKLWDHVFCVYGFPERIHTDQGTNFESELIAELLALSGVSKSRTTAYHPMGNGITERFNRTLGTMIRSLPLRSKDKWPQQIQTLTFAYNSTVHETTGYAPFQLMFGRIPRLPVDVMFKQVLNDPVTVDYSNYAAALMSHLSEAAEIAQKHATQEQNKQAEMYNRRIKGVHLHCGDRVLIANKSERGKRKLADKWEPTVYTIVDSDPKTHIYKVEDDKGLTKVVHRNMLLDISFLPVTLPEETSDESATEECSDDSECESLLSNSTDCLEDETSRNKTYSGALNREHSPNSLSVDEPIQQDVDSSDTYHGDSNSGSQIQILSDEASGPCDSNSDSPSANPVMSNPDVGDSVIVDVLSSDHEQGKITTRAGRVVKRVNRLIETMAQKPFKMPNLSNSFLKKSQSVLSLF